VDGFIGGLWAGYNIQINRVVVGIEGEVAYLNFDEEEQDPLIEDISVGREDDSIASFETDFYGALTGRVGFAFDRALIYAKGGVAFANVEASFRDDSFDDPVGATLDTDDSDDETLVGYTLGGGAEFAVTQNVTVRGEYTFTDLGEEVTTTGTDLLGREFRFDQEIDDIHMVKAWRFAEVLTGAGKCRPLREYLPRRPHLLEGCGFSPPSPSHRTARLLMRT
jgi:outer membrane immunogenic protein